MALTWFVSPALAPTLPHHAAPHWLRPCSVGCALAIDRGAFQRHVLHIEFTADISQESMLLGCGWLGLFCGWHLASEYLIEDLHPTRMCLGRAVEVQRLQIQATFLFGSVVTTGAVLLYLGLHVLRGSCRLDDKC